MRLLLKVICQSVHVDIVDVVRIVDKGVLLLLLVLVDDLRMVLVLVLVLRRSELVGVAVHGHADDVTEGGRM